jgi:chaperonin cofactor prefoldin
MVTDEVTKEAKRISERETVDINAGIIANVLLVERKDIARNRALATKLLEELEGITGNQELLAAVGEMMAQPEDAKGADKLNELYHKVIALPSRIKSMKELADTLKTLIGLERQAFGLGEVSGTDAHEDTLDKLR